MTKMMEIMLKAEKARRKSEKSLLHPMLLLAAVVLFCAVLSYVIPAGTYERVSRGNGKELIDPYSFSYLSRTPATVLGLLESLTLGLQNAADIIFFLMIIGGMFEILNGTGAMNVGIANAISKLKGKEILMIPLLMLIFGAGAAFCGNFEEFLVFVPLVLACCITVGYDSLTAVAIIFVAATAGYAGAVTNAFTVGEAQEIAGLDLFSGMQLRIILFGILETISVIYVCFYARMVRKNPKLSGAYQYDLEYNQDKKLNLKNIPKLTKRQAMVLLFFLTGMIYAIWGVVKKGYYIDELSGIFLITGVAAGAVGGLKPGKICECFEKGFRNMVLPCIMIGLANAAVILLQKANVMDTILYYMAEVLWKMPNSLMSWGMFLAHEVINVFVPSGSAQASITMPLMIPMADEAGLSRQTAVLAYQLGDAFTNIVAPTGGEILAALAICRVPFGKWLKFLLPLFAIWIVTALLFLSVAVRIGY